MKPTLGIIFLAGIGVGGGTATLVDTSQITFRALAPQVEQKLDAKAAARFESLSQAHVIRVLMVPRGPSVQTDAGVVHAPVTRAEYSVPSLRAGGVPYTGSHLSFTNGDTLASLLGLNRAVIFPAAKTQCPDLADAEAYPALEDGHVEYSGVEADKKAVARLVVPSLLAGLPPVTCDVRTPAPAEAMRLVAGMVDDRVLPAIREETGLR